MDVMSASCWVDRSLYSAQTAIVVSGVEAMEQVIGGIAIQITAVMGPSRLARWWVVYMYRRLAFY